MLVTLAWEIFQAGSDIDDAGIALGIDQLEDAFEVIFDRGRNCRKKSEIFSVPSSGQNSEE